MATNNKNSLENVLPRMAKDIGIMKMGMMKLAASQSSTPRSIA